MTSLDACISLLNSKVPEQRARGVSLLERGEFGSADSVKVSASPVVWRPAAAQSRPPSWQHIDALLAALSHPLTEFNVAIRQNVLRVLPALLQRCGGSLRSSLDRVLPHLAERLVDADVQSRAYAVRRAGRARPPALQ